MRIVLIGNGPSIRNFDWSQIKDTDITIGCNHIYKSGYVPNIICFTDTKYMWDNHKDEILSLRRIDGSKPQLIFQRNEDYQEMDKYDNITLMLFVDLKVNKETSETVWADFDLKDKDKNNKNQILNISDKQEKEGYQKYTMKEISFKDFLSNFYSCGKFNTLYIPETGNTMTNLCIPWGIQICQSFNLSEMYMIGVDASWDGHFYDKGDPNMQITYLKEKISDYSDVLSELFNINLINANDKSELMKSTIKYKKIFKEF